jgi:hypothetical protein
MELTSLQAQPVTVMVPKSTIPVVLLVGLIFIGFGDKFLPQPLSGMSYYTRTTLNQMMMSSFQVWQPKSNPNARTERALEDTEKSK